MNLLTINGMLSKRLGFNVIEIDRKTITREQHNKAKEFLTNGIKNMITALTNAKRPMNHQEWLIIDNFNNINLPPSGENTTTLDYIIKLTDEHFSPKKIQETKSAKEGMKPTHIVGPDGKRKVRISSVLRTLLYAESHPEVKDPAEISRGILLSPKNINYYLTNFELDKDRNVILKEKVPDSGFINFQF